MSTIIVRKRTALSMVLLVLMATSWGLPATTAAREVRNTTRTNVNRNVNVDRNVNRNVNVQRDIDVDVDHHYRGHHPVATAAAVTAAATVTAVAVGSMVHSLPPACSTVVVNGLTYQNCSGTWYQPQYAGSQVTYVMVNAP